MYEKFAELLDKNNKTAYVVAKETGIAQSVLSDWKTGRSTPKFDKLLVSKILWRSSGIFCGGRIAVEDLLG